MDEDYEELAMAASFLEHLRFGRDAAEGTCRMYAGELVLYLEWCRRTGRDLLGGARDLDRFMHYLRVTPITRAGRGCGQPRGARRINHILSVVREFYRHAAANNSVDPAVLASLFQVADNRFLPAELRPEGSGLAFHARPRHALRPPRQVRVNRATDAEWEAMLAACRSWRDRFLVVLLWFTGLRIGEALGLRRSDVHFSDHSTDLGCLVVGPHLHVVHRDNINRASAKSRNDRHRGAKALVFNLRGFGEIMRLEFLIGIQAAVADGRRTPPSSMSRLIDYARSSGAVSLLSLASEDHAGAGTTGGIALRYLAGELEVVLATPETEARKDSWNLRVFGQSGRLNFSRLSQPWLRASVKTWALSVLPRLQTQRTFISGLYALEELSVSLAQRPDRGADPRRLCRRDIEAFTIRLAHLAAADTMSTYRRTYTIRFVTRFLREAREEGLAGLGGPMAGLPHDFALGPADQVHRAPDDESGKALPQLVMDQLLSPASLRLLEDQAGPEWRAMLELQAVVGRRTGELCNLHWDCLVYDERVDDQGVARRYPVLVYDMPKVRVRGYRLPITENEAAIIRAQQERSRSRYPDAPAATLALFPTPVKNPHGTKSFSRQLFAHVVHEWAASQPSLDSPDRDADGRVIPFPRELVIPYAFRHTFAQRHADAGTAVDVLSELMGHTTLAATQGYYRVSARRRRSAVDALAALQVDRKGRLVRPLVETLLESEALREQIGEVSVPFGTCVEPSNVKAQGRACPMRFQCLGCAHYRTDPSYQDALRAHLTKLLTDKERLATALPDLDEWARLGALPSDGEIEALRRLIRRNEELMADLEPQDRTTVEEAIQVMRAARAQMQSAIPVQLLGASRQPTPTLFPNVRGHSDEPQ